MLQTHDGGIADENFHEPHAGYTFCSLGALSYVGRLNVSTPSHDLRIAPSNPQEVIRWLVDRQTSLLEVDASLDSEFVGSASKSNATNSEKRQDKDEQPLHQSPDKSVVSPEFRLDSTYCVGLNGRTNKVADTCYAWWGCASLHILGYPKLYDRKAVEKYLLEKTQHPVLGGFGKFPGDLPDLYHSCLGLTALSLAGNTQLKELDAGMCISREAKARLPEIWETLGL